MSGPIEEIGSESLMDNIKLKLHHHDESTSSSDSDNDRTSLSSKKFRLFGRKKPVHSALGGGKSADIILWRNKQISAATLVGATVLWLVFEWLGYHLFTFVCHALILSLAILFCWSNVSCAINRSMPTFPEVILPEDLFVSVALSLRYEMNRACSTFREVASGKDLKKFLMVIASLWVLSVVGSCFSFLTLVYMVFVLLHTVPFLYEQHEDIVDNYAEKWWIEIRKQYKELDEKLLQKIPKCPFKSKKL
ncbi:reticulon-like protein B1 [Aristolochia californica]|uniref:reticulon-like protein B1 n=1 Tax=Aristolochia californica TaxID=171875 RepID=UPI0035DF7D1E